MERKTTKFYSTVIVISKSEANLHSQVGQQLALVINELIKSGELK